MPFFELYIDEKLCLQVDDPEEIDTTGLAMLIVEIMRTGVFSLLKSERKLGENPPEITRGTGAFNELKALHTARCLVEELRYLGVTAIPVDTQS